MTCKKRKKLLEKQQKIATLMIHTHTDTTIHLYLYILYILRANSSLLAISIEPQLYTQFICYARSIISVQSLSLILLFRISQIVFNNGVHDSSCCLSLSLSIFVICIQISSIISTSHNKSTHKHTLHSFTFIYRQGAVSLAHLSL